MTAFPRPRWCVLVCVLLAAAVCAVECAAASVVGARTATPLADAGDVCSSWEECYFNAPQNPTLIVLFDIAGALNIYFGDDNNNVCTFTHVTCRTSGVEVDLSNLGLSGSISQYASWNATAMAKSMVTKMTFDGNSGIVGSLPASWGSLTKLQHFSADGTSVSGTLPDSWAGMASLETLLLSRTSVSGTIPAAWGVMTSLKTVSFAHSSVSGSLPASWGSLTKLQHISADGTSVSGTLPDSWAGMASLETLLLNRTSLGGTIPASWSAMTSLKTVSFARSDVTGCLPDSWTQDRGLKLADVGLPANAECEARKGKSRSFPWWAILIIVLGSAAVIAVAVTVSVCAVRHNWCCSDASDESESSDSSKSDQTDTESSTSSGASGRRTESDSPSGVTRVKDSPPDRKGDVAVSSAEVEAAPEAAPAENKTAGNPLSRNAVDQFYLLFQDLISPQPSPRSSPEPASRDLYDTS